MVGVAAALEAVVDADVLDGHGGPLAVLGVPFADAEGRDGW